MIGFGMMGGLGLIGLLFNLVILVGVVVLVAWAVKRFSGDFLRSNQSPRDILQERYARGEIPREQYEQMLSDLG